MADNLSPEEVKRRLILFLRIPAEVWTDILKLFPRRVLVQQIAPVCYRLKEISNKNVKNIHVIENADRFAKKLDLEADDPETIKQLEHLAGNDCQLASQFRLRPTRLTMLRIWEKSQAILLHSLDLFNGCHVRMVFFGKDVNKNSPLYLECLSQLEEAKPIQILLYQTQDQVVDFWHNPTFQNCNRVNVNILIAQSEATNLATFENIFDWLHHHQNTGSADRQVVRSMIFLTSTLGVGIFVRHIDWLINRCTEDIQRAREPADRRSYVFCWDRPGFGGQFRPIENKSTGEVLLLDRVNPNGQPSGKYRLRRCLTEEVANVNGPYAEEFENYGEEETTETEVQIVGDY